MWFLTFKHSIALAFRVSLQFTSCPIHAAGDDDVWGEESNLPSLAKIIFIFDYQRKSPTWVVTSKIDQTSTASFSLTHHRLENPLKRKQTKQGYSRSLLKIIFMTKDLAWWSRYIFNRALKILHVREISTTIPSNLVYGTTSLNG